MFFKKPKFEQITTEELKALKNVNLIDVRTKEEYNFKHAPNAKNIEMGVLLINPEFHLKKDKTYYIICQSGGRSASTCTKLESLGYDVVNVIGGMNRY